MLGIFVVFIAFVSLAHAKSSSAPAAPSPTPPGPFIPTKVGTRSYYMFKDVKVRVPTPTPQNTVDECLKAYQAKGLRIHVGAWTPDRKCGTAGIKPKDTTVHIVVNGRQSYKFDAPYYFDGSSKIAPVQNLHGQFLTDFLKNCSVTQEVVGQGIINGKVADIPQLSCIQFEASLGATVFFDVTDLNVQPEK